RADERQVEVALQARLALREGGHELEVAAQGAREQRRRKDPQRPDQEQVGAARAPRQRIRARRQLERVGKDRKSTRLNSSHRTISALFPYTTLFRSRADERQVEVALQARLALREGGHELEVAAQGAREQRRRKDPQRPDQEQVGAARAPRQRIRARRQLERVG